MKKFFNKYYPELAGLFVFIVYLFTLGRSVGEFDSGELALAQATLSIPHPTGYPLFTLLGFLFNKVPLPISTIIKLNLLNTIWCSLIVIVLIRTTSIILNNLNLLYNKKIFKAEFFISISDDQAKIISIFSGLMLAFSATFWLQSTKVEVYSLQLFISSLIILKTLQIIINHYKYESNGSISRVEYKDWLIVAVLFALGFSNHLMTIYLLPAIIIVYFLIHKITLQTFRQFALLSLVAFSITSLFYLLMMLRAKSVPPWSYGDPSSLSRLIDHVSAKEYSKHFLNSTEGLLQQGSKFLKLLSISFNTETFSFGEFGLSLFLGFAGFITIFFLRREISFYLITSIIVSIIIAVSYNIPDINEYFLVIFFLLSLIASIPVVLLIQVVRKNKTRIILFILLLSLVLIQVLTNYNYANRSNFYVIEDFFKNSISQLPDDSILLTDNWGSLLSPALYYQNVENFRTDVKILSPSGYLQFDWYKKIKNVELFDSNYVIIPRNNLFIAFDVFYRVIEKRILALPEHYTLVPQRSFFVLGIDSVYTPLIGETLAIRFSKHIFSESEKYIRELLPFMLESRLLYELKFNNIKNARRIYFEIRKNHPSYLISRNTFEQLIKHKILI